MRWPFLMVKGLLDGGWFSPFHVSSHFRFFPSTMTFPVCAPHFFLLTAPRRQNVCFWSTLIYPHSQRLRPSVWSTPPMVFLPVHFSLGPFLHSFRHPTWPRAFPAPFALSFFSPFPSVLGTWTQHQGPLVSGIGFCWSVPPHTNGRRLVWFFS